MLGETETSVAGVSACTITHVAKKLKRVSECDGQAVKPVITFPFVFSSYSKRTVLPFRA
jgi:hypothetical protein